MVGSGGCLFQFELTCEAGCFGFCFGFVLSWLVLVVFRYAIVLTCALTRDDPPKVCCASFFWGKILASSKQVTPDKSVI